MQVSAPTGGTELRELVTSENGEGHTVGCGLFSAQEKSTCGAKEEAMFVSLISSGNLFISLTYVGHLLRSANLKVWSAKFKCRRMHFRCSRNRPFVFEILNCWRGSRAFTL